MAERLIESATLTVVGMVVVFIGLIGLMLVIMLLSKVAPAKGEKKEAAAEEVAPTITEAAAEPRRDEKEAVAAIAVALAQLTEESQAAAVSQQPRVAAPETGTKSSPWAVAGREELLRSREKAGRQWQGLSR